MTDRATRPATTPAGAPGCPTRPATSAPSAAGSCPRRWSPPSTSSTDGLRGHRPTRRSSPSSTGCSATTPAGPSPLTDVAEFAEHAGGARILLKREDLNHTGSHKINNVLGQALLTKRMGKTRVIAETGAGQHGVATATAAALLRPRLHRLHGRGGHPAPGAQRRPDAAARRRGHPGRPPARARSRTRSTRRCATGWPTSTTPHYLLRHRRRPAPVPGDGPRLPAGHRRRGPRAGARARPAGCPTPSRPASAAAPTRSASSPRSSRRPACGWSASRPAATASTPAGTRRPSPAARPACCTAPAPTCCRTRTARPSSRTRSRAGLDYPGVGPEHAYLHDIGRADVPAGHRRRGDGGVRAALPHRGDHPGDRVRARARRRARRSAASSGPDAHRCWSTCPAAATRTSRPPSTLVRPRRRRRRAERRSDRVTPMSAVADAFATAPRRGPGRAGRLPAGRLSRRRRRRSRR